MKYGYTIALAALLAASIPVGAAQADQPLLSYKDLVREARRYEKLEGSERAPSPKILFRKVRLDLKPFAGGSKDFYVVRKDEIGFVCEQAAPGFTGGTVEATITKHEEGAEGSHFYSLNSCAAVK
jgi:hypothetical protein